MGKLKNKLLCFISTGIFMVAVQSANMFSNKHMYQEIEPKSIRKYEKY